MDYFMEHAVVRRKHGVFDAAFILANVLMVLFGIVAIFDMSVILTNFSVAGLIETVVVTAIAVGLFFYRDRLRVEYDYTFTNGILDFAVIYNGVKRKELGSLKVKNVEAFGKVDSDSFRRYVSMPGVKTTNWFLNRDAELYYFYFQKGGNRRIIVLEP